MSRTIRTYYSREAKKDEDKCVDIGKHSRISILMDKISEYFQNEDVIELFLKIINSDSRLSLRVIDFFVTNYARKNEVIYENITGQNKEKFMVHLSYKSQLKAYSKKQFDPFCRRERINFIVEGYEKEAINICTTVGQLNFFRWAIKNDVIEYIRKNIDNIESQMNNSQRKNKRKIIRNKDKILEGIPIPRKEKNNFNGNTKVIYKNVHKKKENSKQTAFVINTGDNYTTSAGNKKDLTLSTTKKISKHNVVITVKFD
jgi:hypothetical protein